eukprot:COSAG01_NODE_57341_length_312_cov_292.586854_1_plen_24_part_10
MPSSSRWLCGTERMSSVEGKGHCR